MNHLNNTDKSLKKYLKTKIKNKDPLYTILGISIEKLDGKVIEVEVIKYHTSGEIIKTFKRFI